MRGPVTREESYSCTFHSSKPTNNVQQQQKNVKIEVYKEYFGRWRKIAKKGPKDSKIVAWGGGLGCREGRERQAHTPDQESCCLLRSLKIYIGCYLDGEKV